MLLAGISCEPSGDPVAPDASDEPHGTLRSAATITIIDLGTLGGTSSYAYGINDVGQVVGTSRTAGEGTERAFLWQNGVMTDLGTLGGIQSFAFSINEAGQVVGGSLTAGNLAGHAFLWQDGIMTDLGTLGGTHSQAYGINDAGQVVGESSTADGLTHAFRWQNGVMTDLGSLGPVNFSFARDINNPGDVTGGSETGTGFSFHAFLWQNGVVTDLGTLGGSFSTAWGINDAGQVVGNSRTSGNAANHAFLWQNGVMTDLGSLGGTSVAEAINGTGQIVGWSNTADGFSRALLWNAGATTDLGTLGGTYSYALGINEAGQIVGGSATPGDASDHATMWILGPAPPQEALADLIEDVQALQSSGAFNQGEANSLISKLEAAAKLIERGSTEPAIGLVMAFVHELEALVESDRLTTAQAQPMIDAAMELVEQLDAS